MKLPISWLKKYIDVDLSTEALAERLTMSGTAVESIEREAGEEILSIEVTTNRPDCLSMVGLAREVAALTGKRMHLPKISVDKKIKNARGLVLRVEDPKGCPHYTARLIEGVRIGASRPDVQKVLSWVGVRALSNAVDATNFVLFEMGQPLHAFDYDKLKGGVICVRRAKKGEKFVGIDGAAYELDAETLVIADAESPVAIAGVIGGRETEVTPSTKNILLESALFDPGLVRRASKKYRISTESSHRFERGVNPFGIERASKRAAELLLEWGGGKETGFWTKTACAPRKAPSVLLRTDRVENVLGFSVPAKHIKAIFERLGFDARFQGAKALRVTPPDERLDISQEADLLEEIVRIEGFDKVPISLPATRHVFPGVRDPKAEKIPEIKKFVAATGFDEIVTVSLLSERALRQSGFGTDNARRIQNAASQEQAVFRPSLLPGMLEALIFNIHHQAESAKLFEVGNVWTAAGESAENASRFRTDSSSSPAAGERTFLGMLLYGNVEENWKRKAAASYHDLKGVVQHVLDFLRAQGAEWLTTGMPLGCDAGGSVAWQGLTVARLGRLSPAALKSWDIPHEAYYAEIELDGLMAFKPSPLKVRAVPKFPSVRRDIAFIIDNRVPVDRLQRIMEETASPYLEAVRLFDEYTGKTIARGKRSLAFALAYQKQTGTFTDEEIQDLQRRVGEALKQAFQVEFR